MTELSPARASDPHRNRDTTISKNFFIHYDFASDLLQRLNHLVSHPDVIRSNLVVVGDSGNGKSTLMECFRQANMSTSDPHASADVIPVLYVLLPPKPTLAGLASRILDALGQTRKPSTPERQLVESATKLLRVVGTRVLIIDEAQNISKASPLEKDVLVNFVKTIGETSDLSLVLVGMPSLLALIGRDRQLSRRFDIAAVPSWSCDRRGEDLLFGLEPLLELDQPSNLADDPRLAEWIYAEAEGTIGDVIEILRQATAYAIRSGEEQITPKVLKSIGWTRASLRLDKAAKIMNVSRKTYS